VHELDDVGADGGQVVWADPDYGPMAVVQIQNILARVCAGTDASGKAKGRDAKVKRSGELGKRMEWA